MSTNSEKSIESTSLAETSANTKLEPSLETSEQVKPVPTPEASEQVELASSPEPSEQVELVSSLVVSEQIELVSIPGVSAQVEPQLNPDPSEQDDDGPSFCKVLNEYSSELETELDIEEDDIIEVLSKRPDGWWTGILRQKVGLFPSSFVTPIARPEPEAVSNDEDEKFCKVITPYSAEDPEELQLEKDDIIEILLKRPDGWWSGRLRNKEGFFPSSFVAPMRNPSSPESRAPQQAEAILPQCRVRIPFEGNDEGELTLEEGDVITVVCKDFPSEGWWKGVLNGTTGIFPRIFVQEIIPGSRDKDNDETRASSEESGEDQSQVAENLTKLKIAEIEEDRNKCGICMDKDINSAFFPCGHITCCAECAATCQLCPLCRSTIEMTKRIYLPG